MTAHHASMAKLALLVLCASSNVASEDPSLLWAWDTEEFALSPTTDPKNPLVQMLHQTLFAVNKKWNQRFTRFETITNAEDWDYHRMHKKWRYIERLDSELVRLQNTIAHLEASPEASPETSPEASPETSPEASPEASPELVVLHDQ